VGCCDLVDHAELLEDNLSEIGPVLEFGHAATASGECLETLSGVKQTFDDARCCSWLFRLALRSRSITGRSRAETSERSSSESLEHSFLRLRVIHTFAPL
jgi:hypothetical protein